MTSSRRLASSYRGLSAGAMTVASVLSVCLIAQTPPQALISENGRYRIPGDNPFVDVAGARTEIWAYGFRNPHRLTWDVDPASGTDRLIAASIGLSTWEAIYFVHKGALHPQQGRWHDPVGDGSHVDHFTAVRN